MDTLDYYRAIAKKAFLDTVDLKSVKKSAIRLFMFLFGLVLWWHFHGLLAVMGKLIETLLWVLVPGGFAFFGIFAWNLFLAPVRLRASERKTFNDQIVELKRTIAILTNELTMMKDSYRPPNLLFEPKIIEGPLITPQGSRVTNKALIAELRITNTSRFGMNVSAKIRYGDQASGDAFNVEGRWIGPFLNDRDDPVMPITLHPGQPRRLAIAVNSQGKKTWYAMDNISPFDGYETKRYELTGPTDIVVNLVGDKDTITKYLHLKEDNGSPSFDFKKKRFSENRFRITKTP